jgi:hypothetical protein
MRRRLSSATSKANEGDTGLRDAPYFRISPAKPEWTASSTNFYQLGRRLGIKQGPGMTSPKKTPAMASEEPRETIVLSQSC